MKVTKDGRASKCKGATARSGACERNQLVMFIGGLHYVSCAKDE